MKKLIFVILCLALCAGLLPAAVMQAMAAEPETCSVSDGYIKVEVSKANGGFAIGTVEGDRLKKSDNNKALLYHSGEYDTSFVSFRVTDANGSNAKDYIFGGKYGTLTDPSRDGVSVTQGANGDIIAVWSTEDYGGEIVFTQTISLPNETSTEHGMVSIRMKAERVSGSPVKIQARILLDTALGSNDYGFYQVTDSAAVTETVKTEKIITTGVGYPMQNFYAVDLPGAPSIAAYTVSPVAPYQAAFGHWNSLAASLFDFAPDSSLDFTDPYNAYLTDDSAYALYYYMAENNDAIAAGGLGNIQTFYGVYSHKDTPDSNSVVVDVTAPGNLSLNEAKTDFVQQSTMGIADFTANLNLTNITDAALGDILLTVTTTGNLRTLSDANGQPMPGYDFGSFKPLNIRWTELAAQGQVSKTLYFEAQTPEKAAYEKITFSVYAGAEALSEKLLGEKTVYLLLPGNDGDVPQVHFTSMTPDIIYKSGTRYLYLGVANGSMLDERGNWKMFAYPAGGGAAVEIPHESINVDAAKNKMTVAIPEEIELAPGAWYMQLEWQASAVTANLCKAGEEKLTSPDMAFTVSEDIRYKNDAYGVLCVVQEKAAVQNAPQVYRIHSFADEEEFAKFQGDTENYDEILLIIRGEFSRKIAVEIDDPDNAGAKIKHGVFYEAISSKTVSDGKTVVDNPITINGCLDYEGGAVQVYYASTDVNGYADSGIRVEFSGSEGEIFASDSRNSIWKGYAALTEVKQGADYSLRPYDKNGVRKDMSDEEKTVKLVWPSYTGPAQMISGLVFKLAYAELGKMLNDDGSEIGRVLSFSAAMKIPLYKSEEGCNMYSSSTYWDKMKEFQTSYSGEGLYNYVMGPAQIADEVDQYHQLNDTAVKNKSVQAAVMVQDVLFGCGEGLIGMNFTVGTTISNMVKDMADISAEIKVNTINDWSFGVKGGFQLRDYTIKADISFKSRNNIPVPDNFSVFVGGFEPGWNIDGCGTVWITGGGGGISNLYDTIFCSQGVPPLKLTLSVAFDIVKVMSGTATATLGPRGFNLQAENLKIAKTNITVIKRVGLGLDWYPAINLNASIVVDLFQGVVYGGGYIVLTTDTNYENVFFEMFARAQLMIPQSFPVVGGMTVAGVDLGISTERIWGAVELLSIPFGIVYYWGDDGVRLSAGSKAQPTYPNLLGMDNEIPVGYDAEREQTLYARIGTNIEVMAAGSPEALQDAQLMSVGDATASSNAARTGHKFNLGSYDAANAALVQLSFKATSLVDARTKANTFTITDGSSYALVLYDGSNADTANANVSYDEDTGDAALAFSVTDSGCYNKLWTVSTGETPAEIVLYNVVRPAGLENVSGAASGGNIDLTWDGTDLDKLDSVSFFLTTLPNGDATAQDGTGTVADIDPGYPLCSLSNSTEISSGSKSVPIPADLPSGTYYIRAVYSQTDTVNGAVYSADSISHSNSNTPEVLAVPMLTPAGDLRYRIILNDAAANNTDGYLVTLYDAAGIATDFTDVNFDKAASGNTDILIGGSYTASFDDDNDPNTPSVTKTIGLTAGTSYYAEIMPYNEVTDGIGQKVLVPGAAVRTAAVMLPAVTTPTVTFTADKAKKTVMEGEVRKDVYTVSELTITAAVSMPVSGTWELDEASAGGVIAGISEETAIVMPLGNVSDGEHVLILRGTNAGGDGFMAQYVFTVDTTAPRLLLSSPTNGSMFGADGKLTITGVTDQDALLTIATNKGTICAGQTVTALGGVIAKDGTFSLPVDLLDPHSSSRHSLTVTAIDVVGNGVSRSAELTHGGLADLKELRILSGGASASYLPPVGSPQTLSLSLAGVTNGGTVFVIDDAYVVWLCQNATGSAAVDQDGSFTMNAGDQGIVSAGLQVSGSAYRTAALGFGFVPDGAVNVVCGIGGSVSGGAGSYLPNEIVTLTATASSGYVFDGWSLSGAAAADLTASTISFNYPLIGSVTAYASFHAVSLDEGNGSPISEGTAIKRVNIPEGVNADVYVPYYIENGQKVYEPISAAQDGKLVFLAKPGVFYQYEQRQIPFSDIGGHWAEESILFAAARNIFQGVGNNMFDPQGIMTRAMFVTVLYRLAGSPAVSGSVSFTDVDMSSWYADALLWATQNDIVKGMTETQFAPEGELTREQLCTLIIRFLDYQRYDIMESNTVSDFTDEQSISSWAAAAVDSCQKLGLVNGKPNNIFDPQGGSTRAENCTVIQRMIEAILNSFR